MIEKIKAEIERRTDILTRIYAEQVERKDEELQTYYHGKIVALEELRSFIESLEKEHTPDARKVIGLDEAAEKFNNEDAAQMWDYEGKTEGEIVEAAFKAGAKWMAERCKFDYTKSHHTAMILSIECMNEHGWFQREREMIAIRDFIEKLCGYKKEE